MATSIYGWTAYKFNESTEPISEPDGFACAYGEYLSWIIQLDQTVNLSFQVSPDKGETYFEVDSFVVTGGTPLILNATDTAHLRGFIGQGSRIRYILDAPASGVIWYNSNK